VTSDYAIVSTPGTIARFLTLGGAHVRLDQGFDDTERLDTHGRPQTAPAGGWPVYAWCCTGCRQKTGLFSPTDFQHIRDTANNHAATCRSIPQPTR
jgi:hypothetical protein